MPPGISSSTVFDPWRYCSTITNWWSGVTAMMFTQLTESIMKKSCSFLVSGEIFVSARTVKIRKSPSGRERTFSQDFNIYDLRFCIYAPIEFNARLCGRRVNRKSYIVNSHAFFLGGPALGHQLQKVFERFVVGALFLFRQLSRALVKLRRHFGGLFLRAAE